ncbi:MAG: tyrosine-type recombinase/integrase [Nocardioidaceae bacterium]|nr:tyrosine-type recombinase/integrase [Nocardioidaceae bacterium]
MIVDTVLMSPTSHLAAAAVPEAALGLEVDEELAELEAIARDLTEHTLAAGTRKAYAKAWRSFVGFCQEHDLEQLPAHPETVRWYVAWMSVQHDEHGLPRFSAATIRQHLAGIADQHLCEGLLDPTGHRGVAALVRGLTKLRATRPVRKRPLLLDDVRRIIAAMEHDRYPAGVSASRDALALWLGFAGALRRSEAAALRLDSLQLHAQDGVHVHVGRSKADQDNDLPDVVVLPFGSSPATCAVCALHRWVNLLVIAGTQDVSLRRRQTMTHLFAHQEQGHCCTAIGGEGLISSADLASPAPLLRATYRNRRSATISAEGISGDALGTMLGVRMAEAGMDPSHHGFHSLRAGHVTQARRNGASTSEIMRAGRWQRAETVEVYDREFNPAARNSVMRLGL